MTLRPALRAHYDSWNLRAINPEMVAYLPIGPVELRGLFSFYSQWQASFYRHDGDNLPGVRRLITPPRPFARLGSRSTDLHSTYSCS